jgi:hypothetical protein
MELIRELLLPIHIAAGFAALILFWVPALTKKGGPAHRAAGRWYVRAMAFITVTGFVLAAFFIAGDRVNQGLFLLFLGVITGTSLWNGWRVLQVKRDPAAYVARLHVAVALVNVLGGMALIAFGIATAKPLFYAFGPVGIVIGGNMLALARRRPDDPKYWLYEHFTGMIGSGIASHVAFLAFGGRQLFGYDQTGFALWLWITPVVLGTAAIIALNFWYRIQAAALSSRRASAAA